MPDDELESIQDELEQRRQLEDLPSSARAYLRKLEKDLKTAKEESRGLGEKLQEYDRWKRYQVSLEAAQVDVLLEDLADLPTDEITPAVLKAKAAEKEAAKQEQIETHARDAGYSSAEEYQRALSELKARRADSEVSMATQMGIASMGPGAPRPDKPLSERKWEAYNKALAEGKSADEARGEMVRVIREDAMGFKG